MFGKAILETPTGGDIGPSRTEGLSDALAMALGRIAARTLSDEDGFVVVTLSDGTKKVIGRDILTGEIIIGRLIEKNCIVW